MWLSRTSGSIIGSEAAATWDGRVFFLAQFIGDTDPRLIVSPVFAHVVQHYGLHGEGERQHEQVRLKLRSVWSSRVSREVTVL